jgi:hypothetical protein
MDVAYDVMRRSFRAHHLPPISIREHFSDPDPQLKSGFLQSHIPVRDVKVGQDDTKRTPSQWL